MIERADKVKPAQIIPKELAFGKKITKE